MLFESIQCIPLIIQLLSLLKIPSNCSFLSAYFLDSVSLSISWKSRFRDRAQLGAYIRTLIGLLRNPEQPDRSWKNRVIQESGVTRWLRNHRGPSMQLAWYNWYYNSKCHGYVINDDRGWRRHTIIFPDP